MRNKCIFKIVSMFFIVYFSISPVVYADDIDYSEDYFPTDSDTLETSSDTLGKMSINSRAYIVLDRNTNTVLLEKNSNQKRKMASTTKIMTATVVIENCDLSETVTIPKMAAATGGSRLGLKTNDKITVRDLLFGLMLKSGNDAAVALALHVGGSLDGFAVLMNNKAKELGFKNTNFETPHGLDSANHYTTAYELALLSNYAMKNKTFANIVGTKSYTITINGYPKTIENTNELLGYFSGVYGIKTGFTNGANRCLVSCCKRGELDVICVVLGADTKKFRTTDSIKLLEYTFQNFELTDFAKIAKDNFDVWKQEHVDDFTVVKGISDDVIIDLQDLENPVIPLDKNFKDSINVQINCKTSFVAPVEANSCVGELIISVRDTIVYTIPISTTNRIAKKSILDYFMDFSNCFKFIFLNGF